jgi:hypothetical protein
LGLDVTFGEGRGRFLQGKAALRPGFGKSGDRGLARWVYTFGGCSKALGLGGTGGWRGAALAAVGRTAAPGRRVLLHRKTASSRATRTRRRQAAHVPPRKKAYSGSPTHPQERQPLYVPPCENAKPASFNHRQARGRGKPRKNILSNDKRL